MSIRSLFPSRSGLRPWIALLGSCAVCLCSATSRAQTKVWSQQFGTPTWEYPKDVAVSDTGGLLSCGTGLSLDCWISHHDASGAQRWLRDLTVPEGAWANSVVADGSGGALVIGGTWGAMVGTQVGNDQDTWFGRLDPSGSVLWLRQIGAIGFVGGSFIARDGSGGYFVGGTAKGHLAGATAPDYPQAWIAHYDAQLVQSWIVQFDAEYGSGILRAVADGSGGLVLAGTLAGAMSGPISGTGDLMLARMDAAGTLQWVHRFGFTQASHDVRGLSLGPEGEVFLGGQTHVPIFGPLHGGTDGWVARFDLAGNLHWGKMVGTPGQVVTDFVNDVVSDGRGGCVAVGKTWGALGGPVSGHGDGWVHYLDAKGTVLWKTQITATAEVEAVGVAVDPAGAIYVAGETLGTVGAAHLGDLDVWVSRFEGPCAIGTSYCTPSSTSLPGCSATLADAGWPSPLAPAGYALTSGNVPGGNLGICFFGDQGPAGTPFGTLGGMLCVQAPFVRTPPKASGGQSGSCNGVYVFTLADLMLAGPSLVVPGATLHASLWARDPQNADGFLLSDGLTFVVCP